MRKKTLLIITMLINLLLLTNVNSIENIPRLKEKLTTLCGCPSGYFEESQFVVFVENVPQCFSEQVTIRDKSICGLTEILASECIPCHSSCSECFGPSDADCYQCNDEYSIMNLSDESPINKRQPKAQEPEVIIISSLISDVAASKDLRRKKRMVYASKDPSLEPISPARRRYISSDSHTGYNSHDGRTPSNQRVNTDDMSMEQLMPMADKSSMAYPSVDDLDSEPNRKTNHHEKRDKVYEKTPYESSSSDASYEKSAISARFSTSLSPNPKRLSYNSRVFSLRRTTPSSTSNPQSETEDDSTTPFEKNEIQSTASSKRAKKIARKRNKTSTSQALSEAFDIPTTPTHFQEGPFILNADPGQLETTQTATPMVTTLESTIPFQTGARLSTRTTKIPNSSRFRCVKNCPDGTYEYNDAQSRKCIRCNSKCNTCVGPSFMNCTSCQGGVVQAALFQNNWPSEIVACLSECPSNQFNNSGICTACHVNCNGCVGAEHTQCLRCRFGHPDQESINGITACDDEHFFDKPLANLEIILPLTFIVILIVLTFFICVRWHVQLAPIKKPFSEIWRKITLKQEASDGMANFPFPKDGNGKRKIRNDYTLGPPTYSVPDIKEIEDGYELPLPSHVNSNQNTIRSRSRRNDDPLPPTPDVIAPEDSKTIFVPEIYANEDQETPQKQSAENAKMKLNSPRVADLNNPQPCSSTSETSKDCAAADNPYSNSEGLYANC